MACQLEEQGKAIERAAEVKKHLSVQLACHFVFRLGVEGVACCFALILTTDVLVCG